MRGPSRRGCPVRSVADMRWTGRATCGAAARHGSGFFRRLDRLAKAGPSGLGRAVCKIRVRLLGSVGCGRVSRHMIIRLSWVFGGPRDAVGQNRKCKNHAMAWPNCNECANMKVPVRTSANWELTMPHIRSSHMRKCSPHERCENPPPHGRATRQTRGIGLRFKV